MGEIQDQDDDWVGPWCNRYAQVVKGGAVIIDEVFEYRRHVYMNGEFKTERIDIHDWWNLGYKYRHLPDMAISLNEDDTQ